MQKSISVVIPNYNGVKLFPETLPTVFTALQTIQLPNEVIVADDGSTDGSVEFLQKNFPQVKIISHKKNSGFSVTANNGIRSAQYDLILLLNSDVKLEPDYFGSQLKYFEHEDTFGVMGRIIGWNDDEIQDGAKYPLFHNVKIKTSVNYILQNEQEMKNGLFTMYLSGANALLDRKKFLLLDGFNELFSPFYVEDYELSLRAWRLGWKCYYEHNAVCRHQVSTTMKSKEKANYIRKIYNRNKMYLHAVHLNKKARLLWMFQLMAEVFIQSLLLKFYYSKAFLYFLKNYEKARASRKRFQQMAGDKKIRSVNEVAQMIVNSVKNKKIKFFKSGIVLSKMRSSNS